MVTVSPKCVTFFRYSASALPLGVNCVHNNSRYKCSTLTGKVLRQFHSAFYKVNTKAYQDAIILKCCSASPVKRRRPRSVTRQAKQFTTKYFIIVDKRKIPVCQKVFLGTLRIKKGRLNNLLKKSFQTGEFPSENRGGDHRSHLCTDKRETLHTFIQSLTCSEPHYCRSDSQGRKYLPSELNIRKLYKMYVSTFSGSYAKESYFRYIFATKYNLGFGSPRTDICSTCLHYQEQLKFEQDPSKKLEIMTAKRVHGLRAKAFYHLLKTDEPGVIILSYDCQKNLPLPKLPDQSTYYSRQLYLYNFTIVEGSSKSKLTADNVYANIWTENEYAKNANTIASAVYHHLNQMNLINFHTIRLIADGCGSQNKNSIFIAMCCKWLLEHPGIKNIELVFPVTGHSYLPADRVFGNSEKQFRRLDTITSPIQYENIISNQAKIIRVGTDFHVLNWKKAAEKIIKPPGQWSVQFSKCKRFFIRRSKKPGNVLVNAEMFYKTKTGRFESITRRNKIMNMLEPEIVSMGIPVKSLKKQDVNSLLVKHFGQEWKTLPNLSFYANILDNCENIDDEILDDAQEELCAAQEECPLLTVKIFINTQQTW